MNQPATAPDSFARIISTPVTSRNCDGRTVEAWQALHQLTNVESLAALMKEAADAHHEFEVTTGKPDTDWPTWYANFILTKLTPRQLAVGYPRTSEQAERELDAAARAKPIAA